MNILVAMRHYPISMGLYMKRALRRMGHNLWTIGTFDSSIPWNRDRDYSAYVDRPDYEVGETNLFLADEAVSLCPFRPDLILNIDSVFGLVGHNSQNIPQAIILTDPHCLQQHYANHVSDFDRVFCMQKCYMGDYDGLVSPDNLHWMPYAFDETIHLPAITSFSERPYDVGILSALLYPGRLQALAALEAAGLRIRQDSGLLFEEAVKWYGDCIVSLNVSSEQDLPARFWEGLATANLVATGRVPDLADLPGLKEGTHYFGFDGPDELVDKAIFMCSHFEQAEDVALAGFEWVHQGKHCWTERMRFLLETCGVT